MSYSTLYVATIGVKAFDSYFSIHRSVSIMDIENSNPTGNRRNTFVLVPICIICHSRPKIFLNETSQYNGWHFWHNIQCHEFVFLGYIASTYFFLWAQITIYSVGIGSGNAYSYASNWRIYTSSSLHDQSWKDCHNTLISWKLPYELSKHFYCLGFSKRLNNIRKKSQTATSGLSWEIPSNLGWHSINR